MSDYNNDDIEDVEQQNDEVEIEPFLALEEDGLEQLCENCDIFKSTKDGVNMVCATYKARNNYQLRNGGKDVKSWYYCADFKSAI